MIHLVYFRPFTGVLFVNLSAAWFPGMTATALPLDDSDGTIAKNEVKFPV